MRAGEWRSIARTTQRYENKAAFDPMRSRRTTRKLAFLNPRSVKRFNGTKVTYRLAKSKKRNSSPGLPTKMSLFTSGANA
jgi:hypothetical protein